MKVTQIQYLIRTSNTDYHYTKWETKFSGPVSADKLEYGSLLSDLLNRSSQKGVSNEWIPIIAFDGTVTYIRVSSIESIAIESRIVDNENF